MEEIFLKTGKHLYFDGAMIFYLHRKLSLPLEMWKAPQPVSHGLTHREQGGVKALRTPKGNCWVFSLTTYIGVPVPSDIKDH